MRPAFGDWYPCYPDNKVKVTLHMVEGKAWVSVWGADDYGFESKAGGLVQASLGFARVLQLHQISSKILLDRSFSQV